MNTGDFQPQVATLAEIQDIPTDKLPSALAQKDEDGRTMFHRIVSSKSFEAVKWILNGDALHFLISVADDEVR